MAGEQFDWIEKAIEGPHNLRGCYPYTDLKRYIVEDISRTPRSLQGEMMAKIPATIEDLQAFIKNGVQESLHLDYKSSRAISDGKPLEIAKDVSAFANSDGGLLIYGIRETNHLPLEIDEGVDHKKFSREWLEQSITSNIHPRIDGLRIVQIPLSDLASAFAIEIPKSFRGPHQEQSSKRYYKRFNFKSEPMEDYEIRDISNRSHTVMPLVYVDIEIRHGVIIDLVVINIGKIPAKDVVFEFSKELAWRNEKPPIFVRGIKYLPPGRTFRIMYNTFQDVLAKKNSIPSDFDVTVRYFHPEIGQRISDEFHIDLLDYMHTSVPRSEIYEHGKKVEDAIKDLTREIRTLNESLNTISKIAGPTGLDISVTAARNLFHVLSQDRLLEKIDPFRCDHLMFKEVLNVGDDLAFRLESHFLQGRGSKNLSEIEGMTEEIIKKFKDHFLVEES